MKFKLSSSNKPLLIIVIAMGLSISGIAQENKLQPESIDSAYWTIQKNTFRINLSFPFLSVDGISEGTALLSGMHEWSMKRNFSLVSKLGINSYNDPYEKVLTKFSYQALASIEQRYYFNFNRRIRKAKPILNNSGTYLGLEARWLSEAYKSPNDNSFKTPASGLKFYYNIGHQVQLKNYFFNYHFGFEFPFQSVTNGVGIGYVF